MSTPKKKVMYMHTLDSQPASFTDRRGAYIYFAGGSANVILVPSLRQIRREQRDAMRAARQEGRHHATDPKCYGYCRVEVP